MKKMYFLIFLIASGLYAQTPNEAKDKAAIKAILQTQETAWNNFDINTFMQTYWKSAALTFYGSSGITKGWQATLDRYKKSYPTEAHFGKLKLTTNDISKINEGAYAIFGQFHLTRSVGNIKGIFMLVVKNIDGEWKIIADTSCKTEQILR